MEPAGRNAAAPAGPAGSSTEAARTPPPRGKRTPAGSSRSAAGPGTTAAARTPRGGVRMRFPCGGASAANRRRPDFASSSSGRSSGLAPGGGPGRGGGGGGAPFSNPRARARRPGAAATALARPRGRWASSSVVAGCTGCRSRSLPDQLVTGRSSGWWPLGGLGGRRWSAGGLFKPRGISMSNLANDRWGSRRRQMREARRTSSRG